ncbi:hypothetical protein C8R43DRAFT_960734 [Mycena crocata]|nr:hypothetical protein C8R43DRAFT_960734 [Mycena crocata]
MKFNPIICLAIIGTSAAAVAAPPAGVTEITITINHGGELPVGDTGSFEVGPKDRGRGKLAAEIASLVLLQLELPQGSEMCLSSSLWTGEWTRTMRMKKRRPSFSITSTL